MPAQMKQFLHVRGWSSFSSPSYHQWGAIAGGLFPCEKFSLPLIVLCISTMLILFSYFNPLVTFVLIQRNWISKLCINFIKGNHCFMKSPAIFNIKMIEEKLIPSQFSAYTLGLYLSIHRQMMRLSYFLHNMYSLWIVPCPPRVSNRWTTAGRRTYMDPHNVHSSCPGFWPWVWGGKTFGPHLWGQSL